MNDDIVERLRGCWAEAEDRADAAEFDRDRLRAEVERLRVNFDRFAHERGLRLAAEAQRDRLLAAIGDPDEMRYHARGDVADTGAGDDLQAALRSIAGVAAEVLAEMEET